MLRQQTFGSLTGNEVFRTEDGAFLARHAAGKAVPVRPIGKRGDTFTKVGRRSLFPEETCVTVIHPDPVFKDNPLPSA